MKVYKRIKQFESFICRYFYYRQIATKMSAYRGHNLEFNGCHMEINSNVADILKQAGEFSFLPNSGNLGDFLIAKGEFNFFRAHNLSFQIFDDKQPLKNETLIYGGGGVFTSFWDYSAILRILKRADAKKIIILPSSFYQCADLINILDRRFTVFCREQHSYNYLCAAETKADIRLAEDMALNIKRDGVIYSHPARKSSAWELFQIDKNLYQPYCQVYAQLNKILSIPEEQGLKIGYFMRKDAESDLLGPMVDNSLDISLAAIGNCSDESFTAILATLFLNAINCVDVVVSDRLHVCIGGALLGKKVLMIDNGYKKLSGVYNQSLRCFPKVIITSGENVPQVLKKLKQEPKTSDSLDFEKMDYSLDEFTAIYLSCSHLKNIKNLLWSSSHV